MRFTALSTRPAQGFEGLRQHGQSVFLPVEGDAPVRNDAVLFCLSLSLLPGSSTTPRNVTVEIKLMDFAHGQVFLPKFETPVDLSPGRGGVERNVVCWGFPRQLDGRPIEQCHYKIKVEPRNLVSASFAICRATAPWTGG